MRIPSVAVPPPPAAAQPTTGGDVAQRLDGAISTIARWATRHDVRADVMRRARCDLPASSAWLLARIAEAGPVRPCALATFLAVDPSTVTPKLQRLERERLVHRAPDPSDRRAALVQVTPHGVRLLDRLHRARQRLLLELLRDWTPLEAQQAADAVGLLARRLGSS